MEPRWGSLGFVPIFLGCAVVTATPGFVVKPRWGCVCREVITLCNIREPGEGIPQIDEDLAVCSGQTMSPSFSRIAASKFVGNDKA